MKRTPLYEVHVQANAKLIDFGGWEMPIQYAGILEEHRAVRTKAGLFDVSHMGEIEVIGPAALEMVNTLITNDITKLADGQVIYTPMCYEHGGIVDDLLVYRHNAEHFLLVVNASNTEKDFAWVQRLAQSYNVKVENISTDTAQLALQGPLAQIILQRITDIDLAQIKYYWFSFGQVAGVKCLISRTGYTGEDGFELYFVPEFAQTIWNEIMKAGREEGIQAIGLGARDTLRFEAGLPLYGNELAEDISPLDSGLEMFVKLDKAYFIGRQALVSQKAAGIARKSIGLEMIDRGIPRSHYSLSIEGRKIGFVSSGSFSPTLGKNIGLGLISTQEAELGKEIEVMVRGKGLKARIVQKPFYKTKAVINV
ncbi:MAG TPA: glycine cleavage system aminomethyltransferase GcvT [Desulfosporosinus sp.]|nr:glycine cleavage system aminomethyltransferase GcvT [Desulfosporosinus sp.]